METKDVEKTHAIGRLIIGARLTPRCLILRRFTGSLGANDVPRVGGRKRLILLGSRYWFKDASPVATKQSRDWRKPAAVLGALFNRDHGHQEAV